MNSHTTLYNPKTAPMDGMNSSLDPAGVRWRLVDNWRISRNSMQGRNGCDELTSGAIVGSATYKGHWIGRLGGTEYVYLAVRVSSATRIYSINTSSWAATEITSASTRFSTDGLVRFAAYRELGIADGTHEGADFLYATNGTADVPRCTKQGASIFSLLENYDISAIPRGTYAPTPAGYVKINDPALITATASDADVTVTETGASPLCEVYVTVGAATDVGDYANIEFLTNSCVNIFGSAETTGDTLNLSRSRQLWMLLYDSAADPIHNYFNVEVTQGGGQVQIYDAQGANRLDPQVVSVGGGYYLVGFRLQASVASTLTAVSAVRVEFARLFAANRTFRISAVMAGGRIPQGTSYELTFALLTARNESPTMVLDALPTAAFSEYGASRDIGFKLPDSDAFWYSYRIDWGGTVPTATTAVDATFLYRKEPGDARALFVADIGVGNSIFNDSVNPNDRVAFRPSPSPGGRGPISGRAVLSNNDRLIVGGVNGGGSQVWMSDEFFPLRFRAFATDEDDDGYPDPDSGLSKSFPGEEVYALVKMPGSLVGLSPFLCITTEGSYRFEGADAQGLSRPTLANTFGTIYPDTVVAHKGAVFYLDINLVNRQIGGGLNWLDLSTNIVDDQFENNDVSAACAVMWKERYGIAHRASGASINQRVLQFDTLEQKWCRDSYTTANQNWAGMGVQGTGSSRKLLGFTNEGRIYHLEKSGQTDDDGTAISGTLTTGELHDDFWVQRVWGSVGVIVDSISGATWTITRTNEQDTSDTGSGVGTINVGAATTRTYRYEKSSGTNLVQSGIRTAAVRLSITGTIQPGKYLKSLILTGSDGKMVPTGDRT